MDNFDFENEVQYRFTAWLQKMVKRARIDYLRMKRSQDREESLNDYSRTKNLTYEMKLIPAKDLEKGEYDFEREDIAHAFSLLSITKRKVLLFLFVEELTPKEIAELLCCSEQSVSNLKRKALKKLKEILEENNEF